MTGLSPPASLLICNAVNIEVREIYFNQAGQRVFNVAINGQSVLSNFDVVSQAAEARIGLSKQFWVTATNGLIKIQFIPVVQNSKISAIEIF